MDGNAERGVSDRQEIDDFSSPADREQPSSPDRILSAVGNEYRRAILDSLTRASDRILEYDALVERVADMIRDEDTKRVSDEHRQRVRIALHHTHLPKLEEAGIIDYEAETRHVQFVGGELEQDLLALIGSHDSNE
jgi:DNA-binding transcriptional ArsR family regulator